MFVVQSLPAGSFCRGDERVNSFRTLHRRLTVAVLAMSFLLLAAACEAEPTPTPELSVDDVLPTAAGELAAVSTARFHMIDEMESGADFFGLTLKTVEGEVKSPDSARIVVDAVAPGLGFVEVAIVASGEQAFMKFAQDAPWVPLPVDQVPFNFGGLGVTLSGLLSVLRNAAIAGRESVGGVQSVRLEGDVVSEDMSDLIRSVDPGHPITLTFWFDEVSYEVQQFRIGGKLFNDDAAGTTRLVTITDINAPVDIQLPDVASGS